MRCLQAALQVSAMLAWFIYMIAAGEYAGGGSLSLMGQLLALFEMGLLFCPGLAASLVCVCCGIYVSSLRQSEELSSRQAATWTVALIILSNVLAALAIYAFQPRLDS